MQVSRCVLQCTAVQWTEISIVLLCRLQLYIWRYAPKALCARHVCRQTSLPVKFQLKIICEVYSARLHLQADSVRPLSIRDWRPATPVSALHTGQR